MELAESDWKIDETKTLQYMLKFYKAKCKALEQNNQSLFVQREEFIHLTHSLINCLEHCVSRSDRLLGYVNRLTDAISVLNEEIKYLHNKVDGEQI